MYYFDLTKITHIKSDGFKLNHKSFRFVLDLETTSNNTNTAIVIMKNPAEACKYHLCFNGILSGQKHIESDATVNHVIANLYSKYKRIIILNLYPYMSSDTNVVRKFYECRKVKSIRNYADQKNASVIFNVLKSNRGAAIFCAWGQNSNLNSYMYANDIYKFISRCNKHHYLLGEFDSTNKCWSPLTTFLPKHGIKW